MTQLSAAATLISLLSVINLAHGQYYGRLLPCPRSYLDPDADCLAGIAGKDYPLHSKAPLTSFKCENQRIVAIGYFADIDADCQVFHVCLKNGHRDTFICPNGTLFNQQFLVCDWWFNVKCADAPRFYHINDYLESPIASRPGPPPSPNVRPQATNPSNIRQPLLQATASQEARPLAMNPSNIRQPLLQATANQEARPLAMNPSNIRQPLLQATASQEARPLVSNPLNIRQPLLQATASQEARPLVSNPLNIRQPLLQATASQEARPLSSNPLNIRQPLFQATASQEARPLALDSQASPSDDQMATENKQSDIVMSTGYSFRPNTTRPIVAAPSGDQVKEAVSPITPVTNPFYSMFQRPQAMRPRVPPYKSSIPATVYGSQAAGQQNWAGISGPDSVGSEMVMPRNKEVASSVVSTVATTPETIVSKSTDTFQADQRMDFAPWISTTNSTSLLGLPRSL